MCAEGRFLASRFCYLKKKKKIIAWGVGSQAEVAESFSRHDFVCVTSCCSCVSPLALLRALPVCQRPRFQLLSAKHHCSACNTLGVPFHPLKCTLNAILSSLVAAKSDSRCLLSTVCQQSVCNLIRAHSSTLFSMTIINILIVN